MLSTCRHPFGSTSTGPKQLWPSVQFISQPRPSVRYHQEVSLHGLGKADAVQLRGHHCWHFALTPQDPAGFHIHLQFLVPSERPDEIYKELNQNSQSIEIPGLIIITIIIIIIIQLLSSYYGGP